MKKNCNFQNKKDLIRSGIALSFTGLLTSRLQLQSTDSTRTLAEWLALDEALTSASLMGRCSWE